MDTNLEAVPEKPVRGPRRKSNPAQFKSLGGIWPIWGWVSRAAVRHALSPLNQTKRFDRDVTLERKRLVRLGVEDSKLGRLSYEGAMRVMGMEVGPEAWKGPPAAVVSAGKTQQARKRRNLNDDIFWVYESLKGGQAGEAPSDGAVAFLEYAKDNTAEFFRVFVPKMLAKVDGEKDEAVRLTDDGMPLDKLGMLLQSQVRSLEGAGLSEGAVVEPQVPWLAPRPGSRVTRDAQGPVG